MKFEVGDKVKVRKDYTIGELVDGFWNGCQIDKLTFLEKYFSDFENDSALEVSEIIDSKTISVKEYPDLLLDMDMFYLFEKNKINSTTNREELLIMKFKKDLKELYDYYEAKKNKED